jgi:hypothetical protein
VIEQVKAKSIISNRRGGVAGFLWSAIVVVVLIIVLVVVLRVLLHLI